MDAKVLIVDDDSAIRRMVTRILQSEKLTTLEAANGIIALETLLKTPVDLILLDVNMPELDGFDTLKAIRGRNINTPVLMLSGNTEEYDAIYALGIGADDYITKPVSPAMLLAKVKAGLRRKLELSVNSNIVQRGVFTYDTNACEFYKNGQKINLSSRETKMFLLFIMNENKVFSKEALYEEIWQDYAVDDNTIMVTIRNLRQKIEEDPKNPEYLKTVWGQGYKFITR